MKIAFDLRRIANPGIGRYMKCLVEAVLARAPENEYLLIMPPGAEELVRGGSGNVERIAPRVKYYSLQEQLELPRVLRRHRVDLFHSPHFNTPLYRVCPTIVSIHDVIYLACPQDLPSRLGRLYYRAMMAASARRAERVVTASEFSRQDIVRRVGADPTKIEVIHYGVDRSFHPVTEPQTIQRVLARYGITDAYLIYTGIYKLRKNHAGLLRAFAALLRKGVQAQLVLAGPLEEGERELRRLAMELGVADQVVFTGFVDEADLPAIYSGARVYACPSLYEGFGLTVLEAMACGVPVVCSRETSLPEVCGAAALYADARNAEDFGSALYQAWTDEKLRSTLINKGRKNAGRFGWDRAAEQTLTVYEEVCAGVRLKAVYA